LPTSIRIRIQYGCGSEILGGKWKFPHCTYLYEENLMVDLNWVGEVAEFDLHFLPFTFYSL
jgi:hypothetical protein